MSLSVLFALVRAVRDAVVFDVRQWCCYSASNRVTRATSGCSSSIRARISPSFYYWPRSEAVLDEFAVTRRRVVSGDREATDCTQNLDVVMNGGKAILAIVQRLADHRVHDLKRRPFEHVDELEIFGGNERPGLAGM